MITLTGYETIDQLYESAQSLIFRAKRQSDNKPVIFKLLKKTYPTPEEMARFKREYEMTKGVNTDGVIGVYDLEKYENSLVMVIEDFNGNSLTRILSENTKLKLGEFLKLALQVTSTLSHIHRQQLMHKDINPSNIVWNQKTGQVKIIDFGISTVLPRENPSISNPNVMEGTLAYMSPEQTGRMNRAMDYRTDLYSLGVSFYQMLTGVIPFSTEDAMELVHCHIAKTPPYPQEVNPEIPSVLSNIIMKLLSKTAEDRYQSAFGLKIDLERCLEQFQTNGRMEDFTIGAKDISDKFQIPEKLYGREQEITTILNAFDKASEGNTELLLVAGYSGIGKSSLVHEVYKPIVAKRGYFIAGKFDQFKRDIPYASLIQAFQELVRQLLTEGSEKIASWKVKLLDVLGSNAQVIINVLPELELIVGKQPDISDLPPIESRNRFNLVFQSFVRLFASKDHPLTIFLDDLQWADSSSLKLIEVLVTDSDTKYMLIIGAYRDNEVDASHLLTLTLEEIEKNSIQCQSITVKPLVLENVSELISETFNCSQDAAMPLAKLCIDKTLGNPFFLNQFLQSLFQERLIEFDPNLGQWTWEIEKIQAKGITDNVVELMAGKIQLLPDETQHVLKLAACIGNQFDLKTLAIVNEKSQVGTAEDLWGALKADLILPTNAAYKFLETATEKSGIVIQYRFLHDRVQQAAYSLIPDDKKQNLHLQIGRLLLGNTPKTELVDHIFSILNHLNKSLEQIANTNEERYRVAELNWMAGEKAKASTAYDSAITYLKAGLSLLRPKDWESHYDLYFALAQTCAECEYLYGNLEDSEKRFNGILSQTKTAMEKGNVYYLMLLLYTTSGKYREALELGRKALRLMGVEFPEKVGDAENGAEIGKAMGLQGDRKPAELINLPLMTDPHHIMVTKLFSILVTPAYFLDPTLFTFFCLKVVNLSLEHGNSEFSSFPYGLYAMVLTGAMGNHIAGYEFGKLGIDLSEKFNNLSLRSRSYMLFGTFLNPWIKHLKTNLPYLETGFRYGLEGGDVIYSCYCYNCSHYARSLMGENLDELYAHNNIYIDFIAKAKDFNLLDNVQVTQNMILAMKGETIAPWVFTPKENDDEIFLKQLHKNDMKLPLHFYYIYKMRSLFLFEQLQNAWEVTQISEQMLQTSFALLWIPEHYFFQSLIAAALYKEASEEEKEKYKTILDENLKKFKNWADHSQENFLHKYYLIAAEIARISENDSEAFNLYDQAIESAHNNEFIQNEAIANELAAKFFLARGKDKIARAYMLEARYCYLKWGAAAKVKSLDIGYPQLLSQTIASRDTLVSATTTGTRGSEVLDLASVLKASQAISGEIVLETLLKKMLSVAIENAGAQRGFLLLQDNGQWKIEAQGSVETKEVTVLQSIPLDTITPDNQLLSPAIINYVERTKEALVLYDATGSGKFINDPYIIANQPKSILCAPILHQGRLTGIIYLENKLTAGAFTPDRLEILNLLSSQTAVSLENAKLYANLEEKVQERTSQLEDAHRKILILEKENTEKQLAGGFAHEMRNALVGPKLVIQHLLGQDGSKPFESKSLINSRKLKGIYLLIKDKIPEDTLNSALGEMKTIFENEEQTEISLNTIYKAVSKGLSITQQIMDYAKVGNELTGKNQIDLNALLQNLVSEYDKNWKEHKIVISLDLTKESSLINGLDTHFESVFKNLLLNAKDALLDKSISDGRKRTIQIKTKIMGSSFLVEVSDNGSGIPPENIDRIFEAFFSTKPDSGTGLGLGVVKKVITLYNGKIDVSSELGIGTSFQVTLPL